MIHKFTSPDNRWHSYWVVKNASELYYRGICFDGSIQTKTQTHWLEIAEGEVHNISPLAVLDNEMNPADSARNLGVFFDSGLNFRQQISQVSSSCFYHIRDLKRTRKSLPLALAKQIAVALVTSKLEYCNSLLHEIPAKDLQKLQRVQNCLARVVTRVGVNSFLSIPNSIPIPFYQFLSQFQFLWFWEKSIPIQFQFLKSQFLINSTQEWDFWYT